MSTRVPLTAAVSSLISNDLYGTQTQEGWLRRRQAPSLPRKYKSIWNQPLKYGMRLCGLEDTGTRHRTLIQRRAVKRKNRGFFFVLFILKEQRDERRGDFFAVGPQTMHTVDRWLMRNVCSVLYNQWDQVILTCQFVPFTDTHQCGWFRSSSTIQFCFLYPLVCVFHHFSDIMVHITKKHFFFFVSVSLFLPNLIMPGSIWAVTGRVP